MLGTRRSEHNMFRPTTYTPTKSVCRCLFGPVDHAEVKKTLAKEMSILDADSVAKWNFDFASEKPLSGKYDWETADESVPPAYNMEHLDLKMLSAYSSFAYGVEKTLRSTQNTEESTTELQMPTTPIKSELFTFTPSKDSRVRTPRARLARRRSTVPYSPRPVLTEDERVSGKRKQSQITDFFPQRKVARVEKSSN